MRQELHKVPEHIVPFLNDLLILIMLILSVWLLKRVRSYRFNDNMLVVSSQIVKEHRNVVEYLTLLVAVVMRCIDVVFSHGNVILFLRKWTCLVSNRRSANRKMHQMVASKIAVMLRFRRVLNKLICRQVLDLFVVYLIRLASSCLNAYLFENKHNLQFIPAIFLNATKALLSQ